MAHDSQIPAEERKELKENLTVSSKPQKTSQDVVLDWLRLYAAMPYMRGDHEITAEVILFYSDSLSQLKNPVALHRAWAACRDKLKFLPQPSEVLAAYGVQLERIEGENKQRKEAMESCEHCRGTGWKEVTPGKFGLCKHP